MRFAKKNKFVFVGIATFGIIVIFTANIIDDNHIPITENNVRSQLEQMYDAEVAEVKKMKMSTRQLSRRVDKCIWWK